MREFERRLDEDGRTSQYPATLSPDDRNVGYFEEAKQMVLRFDQSEAQLDHGDARPLSLTTRISWCATCTSRVNPLASLPGWVPPMGAAV
jgi:hypothetical protein